MAGLFMFLLSIVLFYKIGWEIIFIKKTKDPIPIGIITGMTAI
ncbi:MAG TPA: hypothetical protein PLF61_05620 [Candidatus Goldiibacteriota bacterium]|nr:hypothetical protein [Candidatus Goldiibacteriota bacterium]